MQVKSIDKTNYIRSIDTGSVIRLTVTDYDEHPIDLTAFESVEIAIGDTSGRLRTIMPDVGDGGNLSFSFDSETLLPNGKYILEVHMKDSTGVRVAPSSEDFTLHVTRAYGGGEG